MTCHHFRVHIDSPIFEPYPETISAFSSHARASCWCWWVASRSPPWKAFSFEEISTCACNLAPGDGNSFMLRLKHTHLFLDCLDCLGFLAVLAVRLGDPATGKSEILRWVSKFLPLLICICNHDSLLQFCPILGISSGMLDTGYSTVHTVPKKILNKSRAIVGPVDLLTRTGLFRR